jgi:hypothetical protein
MGSERKVMVTISEVYGSLVTQENRIAVIILSFLYAGCLASLFGSLYGFSWTAMIIFLVIACMPVPKFLCGVPYASDFASSMDDCVPWESRSVVQEMQSNSVNSNQGIKEHTCALLSF